MPFSREATKEEIVARIDAHALGDTPDVMRPSFRRLMLAADEGPVETITISPDRPRQGVPPVIWFHGGGYVFGGPDTHVRVAGYLAERHGLTVHLPRYRLAPEHVWPAQLEDALTALREHRDVILAGDSAGGHLALVTALELARRGTPAKALLLFSPNTDRTGQSGTRSEDRDPMNDDRGDAALADLCFGDRDRSHREVSPLLDDLSLLPPTWIEVGNPEVLLDDSRLLHKRGRAAGADVHLTITDGMLHMGQLWAPWWKAACETLDRAAAFAISRA